jgi:hypothetical protein
LLNESIINMNRVLVTSAGSPQSNGVINSLNLVGNFFTAGIGSDIYDLQFAKANVLQKISKATDSKYVDEFLSATRTLKPDLIFVQHDKELEKLIQHRDEIENTGAVLFWPETSVVSTCLNKFSTWQALKSNEIEVIDNIFLNSKNDLVKHFSNLKQMTGEVWLRSNLTSGGGLGSKRVRSVNEGIEWVERNEGWGSFIAAPALGDATVTYQSVWYEGELICAQARERLGWAYGNLTASGVTGITKACITVDDIEINELAEKVVRAVAKVPHGVFGVDFTRGNQKRPYPTEINICRFFTTIEFFARLGLNMPYIAAYLALTKNRKLPFKIPKLDPDWLWLRSIDSNPILLRKEHLH